MWADHCRDCGFNVIVIMDKEGICHNNVLGLPNWNPALSRAIAQLHRKFAHQWRPFKVCHGQGKGEDSEAKGEVHQEEG